MSKFSFSHIVFKTLVSQGRQKVSLCGNGLIKSFVKKRTFIILYVYIFWPVLFILEVVEIIVGSGENAATSNFSLSHNAFTIS